MEEGDYMQLDFPKSLLLFLFLLTYSWFTMLCPSLMHRDAELNLDFCLFIIKTFLLFILFAHTMQHVGSSYPD